MKPRRVRSNEDRNAGRGGFITLKKVKDSFTGNALFLPDPELSDNPGYYEYFEHYTPATGYCPCPGDDCPLCEEGDNPSTRAKTLWLVDGEIKVFNMNYYVAEEFREMVSEGDNVLGQLFKITKMEGNGQFSIRDKKEKLTKTELNKALKEIDDDYLEDIATKQMRRALKEVDAASALEEDDPDEDDNEDKKEKKSSGKSSGKSSAKKGKPADEEPEEEPEGEGLTVEVVKLKKKDNILTVTAGESDEFDIYGTDEVDLTDYGKGTKLVVSFEKDEDGDFVVSEAEEATEDDPDGEGEVPDSVDSEVVTIKAVNTDEDTLTVEMEDGTEFDLFFLDAGEDDNGRDWSELDISDFEEGQQVTISAAKDDDDDMLASVFPEPVGKSGKKSGGKKAGGKKKK